MVALFFAGWALRGARTADIVDTDAARHALNGALVFDLLRSGKAAEPVQYARAYYSHLPAISLPYHPPLFPLAEAGFYALFGVNVFAARLAVACAVALTAWLLCWLILATHGSWPLALLTTATFLSLRVPQQMASEIMLEFPAMVFVLAALYCVRDLDRGYPLARGLLFASLAGAAVWTKQAVFLGLVPFVLVVLLRRWSLLRERTLWLSSLLFGAATIALASLSWSLQWSGVNRDWQSQQHDPMWLQNLRYYADDIQSQPEFAFVLLLAAARVILLFGPRSSGRPSPNHLYAAWLVAALAVVLFIPVHDRRYLIFALPPFLLLTYSSLTRAWALLSPRLTWLAPGVLTACFCALSLRMPASYQSGPVQAAEIVMAGRPSRILYCGRTVGSFIFAVRRLDPGLRTVVLRGDKLPAALFTPKNLDEFAHRYGVQYIVLEHITWDWPWDALLASPPPAAVLVRDLPLLSSEPTNIGRLRIYKYNNPSPRPENVLVAPSSMLGREMRLTF